LPESQFDIEDSTDPEEPGEPDRLFGLREYHRALELLDDSQIDRSVRRLCDSQTDPLVCVRWLFEPDRDDVEEEPPVYVRTLDESRDCQVGYRQLRLNPHWRETFLRHYADIYERVREDQRGKSDFRVKLVALAESLKIRVISKGPAKKYWLLKPYQKYLSRLIGRNRCFRPTRETVTEGLLNSVLVDCCKKDFVDFDAWDFHSLDYKGATDNLNPVLSNACVDELNTCLSAPEDIASDFRSSLTGHTVDGKPQAWGQLMGSVMSFVVLCIINAAVVRSSFERVTKLRRRLNQTPMVINGDDGLVRAPRDFLPIWESIARVAGLVPSLGKVYTHPTYANINSTSFTLVDGRLTLAPYVNMGLVFGYCRSTVETSVKDLVECDPRLGSIGSRHRQLISSCPRHLTASVHSQYIRHNRALLEKANLPWYEPEDCGGVGLSPILTYTPPLALGPSGPEDDLDNYKTVYGSTWQSIASQFLRDHPGLYPIAHFPTDSPIQVRSVWERLVSFRNRRSSNCFDLSADDIGLLDVSTFYVVPSLVSVALKKDFLSVLRRNQSVWRRLARKFQRSETVASHFLDALN
jgi:hypothetical protein